MSFRLAFIVWVVLIASTASAVEVWVLRKQSALGTGSSSVPSTTIGDSGGLPDQSCTLPFVLPCTLEE